MKPNEPEAQVSPEKEYRFFKSEECLRLAKEAHHRLLKQEEGFVGFSKVHQMSCPLCQKEFAQKESEDLARPPSP